MLGGSGPAGKASLSLVMGREQAGSAWAAGVREAAHLSLRERLLSTCCFHRGVWVSQEAQKGAELGSGW